MSMLQNHFVSMGLLIGRPLDEIVTKVGPYQSKEFDEDKLLIQWKDASYGITLQFDTNLLCVRVIGEYTVTDYNPYQTLTIFYGLGIAFCIAIIIALTHC